jgi:D-alanine transaminase
VPGAYPPHRAIIGLNERPSRTPDHASVHSSIVICYRNGEYLPRASATVSVEDRGFIFGDGVYEVWRVINGKLFETDRHLARLAFGLGELRIDSPDILRAEVLLEVAARVLSENGLLEGEASLYLEVTRGAAPRAHAFPPAGTEPTVFVMANRLKPADELRERGAAAITTPDLRWLRCDIKTIQLLPNVLAKQTAFERGATEAIMIRDGVVTEGSHANVFGVVNGVLRTHPLSNLILPGITRAVLLELARSLDMEVREDALAERELFEADELFIAGTTTDVMPIVRVNDRPIGAGVPGETTKRLSREYRAFMDESVASERVVVARNG